VIFAFIPTVYVPASESTSEAANPIVLPESDIRPGLGPVTVSLYVNVQLVRPAPVVEFRMKD